MHIRSRRSLTVQQHMGHCLPPCLRALVLPAGDPKQIPEQINYAPAGNASSLIRQENILERERPQHRFFVHRPPGGSVNSTAQATQASDITHCFI